MSGVIINGVYYPGSDKSKPVIMNSQYKAWNQDEQRRTHARDIIQMHRNGKPNPAFIREYSEEAARVFNQEELRRYGNEY